MSDILKLILNFIADFKPFSPPLQWLGIEEGLSDNLSRLITGILTVIIISYIKKWFTYRKNKKTAKDLAPDYTYQHVEGATKLFIPSKGQNHSPVVEEEPGQGNKFIVKIALIPWFLETSFNEKKESDKYYLILADSGMGKTTFMINLYMRYISQFNKPYAIQLLPFGDKKILNTREFILCLSY